MNMVNMLTHFLSLIVGSIIMIGAFVGAVVLMDKLIYEVNFWKELKNGNKAVAIFLAAIVIAIAIVLKA